MVPGLSQLRVLGHVISSKLQQHSISLNEKLGSAAGNLIANNCGHVLKFGDKNFYWWPFNGISFLTISVTFFKPLILKDVKVPIAISSILFG